MDDHAIRIRLMKRDDFDSVVEIDKKVLKDPRPEYYKLKFERLFLSNDFLPVSLVAEDKNGTVVGFVMGEVYMGEYGISQEAATLDTIGVDLDHQNKGIGKQLMHEFFGHLKSLGVQKVNTLVGLKNINLTRFFNANQFIPSKTINLERSL